jgi:diguanylate cyclase (GGDEF)-like protein
MSRNFPILVAEDNQSSRRLLEKTLAKAGYDVLAVENGRQALEAIDRKFFPLVLTDWMMPELNGLELCKAIRKRSGQGYVFIILLTARDSKCDIVTGLEAGADDYLTKPFSRSELIARLNCGVRILELERSLMQANEEIRFLSITDPLTRCYNRGYICERLPQEIKRAIRYDRPLSLMLCDIDHFKKVNDIYGHQAGDELLKEFVEFIKSSIRKDVDWLARYGGEEFLIVLPETKLSSAVRVAQRLRRILAAKKTKVDGGELSITASFGVTGFDAIFRKDEILPDIMIRHADQCLYRAKKSGRNRVRAGSFWKNLR